MPISGRAYFTENIHHLKLVGVKPHTFKSVYLRDGAVVLHKRADSTIWQVRFKLYDRRWHVMSTKQHDLDYAKQAACEMYDEARFRERYGLAPTRRKFHAIAEVTVKDLSAEIKAGIKPSTNTDYIRVINKYFVPFFGERYLENINERHISEYEVWRNTLMKRAPLVSTLATHASAWNRIVGTAIQRGWISSQVPIPKMSRRGAKGKSRPAFTEKEINFLLEYLEDYSQGGHSQLARDMRVLLRDYIELLVGTGMRSGTESMNIKWQHIERYTDKKTGLKYLRIWVTGKTGGMHLIARARVEQALIRLIGRVKDFKGMTLDEVLSKRMDRHIFQLPDGRAVKSFHTTFGWLMKASGLLKDVASGENRTLYSLRHTYATLSLMSGDMDIHTLAKQMGTSVGMIERHYSKLTATLAANRLS